MPDSLPATLSVQMPALQLALSGKNEGEHRLTRFIERHLPGSDHPLHEPARHHFAKPGKQLRGRMALASADCFGADNLAALCWAAAVELLHNASLVHDDICDGDMVRRGRASVWAKFGRDTALALGDWLIALSFELAGEAGRLSGIHQLPVILARHMKTTTTGQASEFQPFQNEPGRYPDWAGYLSVSAGKTAPLFVAPVEGIAWLAGQTSLIDPVSRFFTAAGICYQIANDIQNVLGTDGAASPASDLLRRAPNAVIVQFNAALPASHRQAFAGWLASGDTEQAGYWQNQLVTSGAITASAAEMKALLDEARDCASCLPDTVHDIIAPMMNQLQRVCGQISAACPNTGHTDTTHTDTGCRR